VFAEFFTGDALHCLAVQHAADRTQHAGPAQFATEEHIVGDRQTRRQGQGLVDGLNASARASSGERKETGWPSSLISPSSGTSAPESARISEDLPAPLSPITARISPG